MDRLADYIGGLFSFFIIYGRPAVMFSDADPIANPRLCIVDDGSVLVYKWQVFSQTICQGNFNFSEVLLYLQQLEHYSGFVLCPGLKNYPSLIRFKTKHLREWGTPFGRLDSESCSLWHKPDNQLHPTGSSLRDVCANCKKLSYAINQLAERAVCTSDDQKLSRVSSLVYEPLILPHAAVAMQL